MLPNHRCVAVSNPFNPFPIRSRDVIIVSDDVPRRLPPPGGARRGYISGVEVSSFVCSQLRRFPIQNTFPLCARLLLRTRISSSCRSARPPSFFLLSQLRFFLNFVRYPLSVTRRFASRPRQKLKERKKRYAPKWIRMAASSSREEEWRANVKNRKLRDRLGTLFYAL